MIVEWRADGGARYPDLPEGVDFMVIADHGSTCEVEILTPNWPPRTYKADIWRRASEAEAEAIDAMLAAQPVRLRRLWEDSEYLAHTDELWSLVRSAATHAFGQTRADELLAAS